MATVEELVVRAEPEGLEETSRGFEDMQGDLDETTESMEDATGQFEDLQNRWSGALTAVVGGLAVGAPRRLRHGRASPTPSRLASRRPAPCRRLRAPCAGGARRWPRRGAAPRPSGGCRRPGSARARRRRPRGGTARAPRRAAQRSPDRAHGSAPCSPRPGLVGSACPSAGCGPPGSARA